MGISEICTLKGYAEELGIEIDGGQASKMMDHLSLMLRKNETLNLTAIKDRNKAIVLHIIDSLTLAPLLLDACKEGESYLDLGTGGGYPGIPLAIATGLEATLIDSVAKKAAACNEFVEELGLSGQVEVLATRAEELATGRRESYQAVVARAVAPIAVLLEYASPLLCLGGSLVISKAPLQGNEYEEGQLAAELCGMRNVSRETIELPEGAGARELLVYIKSGEAQIKLPRRPGMATKRPLGKGK